MDTDLGEGMKGLRGHMPTGEGAVRVAFECLQRGRGGAGKRHHITITHYDTMTIMIAQTAQAGHTGQKTSTRTRR